MDEEFDNWHKLKLILNAHRFPPTFKEREIWWCSIGINIGFEIFGKGPIFTRPVLIVRKFSRSTFLGIPMSTKLKDVPYHHRVHFKGQEVSLLLDQIRTFDSKRLSNRYGYLTNTHFESVKSAIKDML